ncbi:PREDICTED: serine-rich adhesin for platelets-like [Drosophila arizonae]|uniref:Serine-rich adhesin for platelets-like n=1 Tax=Drosophila arizonae TaxID=7263 RepID=A0ABM1PP82_DROAR|nr:PREDICTED: serine-rich adhesin for platelets-like [Drosophila arizonae]
MTHYAWDEACYHNNKNDALSSADSQQINNSTNYNYDEVQSGAYATYDDEYGAAEEEYSADGEAFGSFNQNYAPYTTTATIITEDNNPNIATVGAEYWRNSFRGMEGSGYNNGYNLTSGPLNDGSSMPIEGTYSKKGNRVGCRLPLAPVIDNSKYRMLSQPITYTQNVLNEHTVYADERIGSFISLPAAAPMRMLPEPHPRIRNNTSQRLLEDNNSLSGILTTNTTITTTATTGTRQNYDVFSQISRPYTSMLPLDYGEYSDYAYNSDNLSAYSDTPPMSNTTQLKLQQQRKISLMLAMTTASVIASGETRIPVQQQQQQYYNTTRRSDNNSYSIYNRSISSTVSTSTSTTNSSVAFSNTTTLASARWSNTTTLTSTMTTTMTTNMTTTMMTTTSTRKLPKRLPSPAVLNKSSSSIIPEVLTYNSLETPIHRTKQLPKLPTLKTKAIPSTVPIRDLATVVSSSPEKLTSMLTSAPLKPMDNIENANSFVQQQQEPLAQEQGQEKMQVDEASVDKNHGDNQFNDQRYQRVVSKSLDSFSIWSPVTSTLPDSPVLHQNNVTSLVEGNVNASSQIKSSIESSLEQSLSIQTKNHQNLILTTTATTSLNEAKKSSFYISEYLKPYPFDSLIFTPDKKIGNAKDSEIMTSTSTRTAYDARKNSIPLNSLETPIPSVNQNLNSNPIATWTTSSLINIETPLSESSSNVSYLLSKPIASIDQERDDSKKTDLKHSHDTVTTLSHLSNVLTTTVVPSSLSAVGITSTSSQSNIVDSPTLTYVDYMKKFELPELPELSPIPDIYSVTITQAQPVLADTTSNLVDFTVQNQATVITTAETQPLESGIDSYKANENQIGASRWLPGIASHSVNTSLADINLINSELSSTADTISSYSQQHESQTEKLVEGETRETLIGAEPLLSHIEEPLVSNVSAFDDSFYDSFNVDLSALTATIAHIESATSLTSALKQNSNGAKCDLTTSNTYINIGENNNTSELTEPCSGYYKPAHKQTDEPPETSPKAKVSSVLGGLSKGIKGGLDGVLIGVSSTIEPTKQNPESNSKKGFGFGLASKLVPNVGSLLVRQDPTPTTTCTSAVSNTPYGYNYVMHCAQLPDNINRNTNTDASAPITPTFDYLSSKSNLDFDYLGNDDSSHDYSYSEYPSAYAENTQSSSDPYKVTMSHELGSSETGMEIETPIKPQIVKPSVTSIKQNAKGASGGMFGSIFGKAAAAVQSATQAVNQGASSVASAVVQKASVQHNIFPPYKCIYFLNLYII